MTKPNEKSFDLLIAGAGVPGLTLAILAAQAGLTVGVIDPATGRPKPGDGRTSALMPPSVRLLEEAGVWDACRSAGGVMTGMTIIDDSRQPPIEAAFKAADIGQGYFGINMPQAALLAALRDRAAATPGLALQSGAALEAFTADAFGITAHCGKAGILRAALLVGADGRRSAVRSLSDIPTAEHAYNQQAITLLIRHSKPHGDISTEFHRPSGPFTLVPLPGQTSSVVWVDFDAAAGGFMRLDRAAFRQALQDRTGGRLGTVEPLTPPQAWPLISLRAKKLTAPRRAFIAEAAHVLHPLGAQGLNLSLRDVGALAAILREQLRLGLDPGNDAALAAYSLQRRNDIELRVAGTDGFNRLVSTGNPVSQRLRRQGLKTIGGSDLLKRTLMRQGLSA